MYLGDMDIQNCTIVGYEERRGIEAERDQTGEVTNLKPVKGSEVAEIDLRLPNGKIVKAAISHNDFCDHITPLFPVTLTPSV